MTTSGKRRKDDVGAKERRQHCVQRDGQPVPVHRGDEELRQLLPGGRDRAAGKFGQPCENIVIRNCRILKGHTLLGIGSEISGGIRNIYMHDCTAPYSVMRLFFVKTNHRRGGFIENIYMKNVASGTAQRVLEIDTEVLYQWKDLVPTYEKRITRIDGIYMDKVTCESADAVYELKGNAELPVKNVLLFLFCTRNYTLFDHLVFVFIALIDQANTSYHHDADQEVVQESTVVSNDWWTS